MFFIVFSCFPMKLEGLASQRKNLVIHMVMKPKRIALWCFSDLFIISLTYWRGIVQNQLWFHFAHIFLLMFVWPTSFPSLLNLFHSPWYLTFQGLRLPYKSYRLQWCKTTQTWSSNYLSAEVLCNVYLCPLCILVQLCLILRKNILDLLDGGMQSYVSSCWI